MIVLALVFARAVLHLPLILRRRRGRGDDETSPSLGETDAPGDAEVEDAPEAEPELGDSSEWSDSYDAVTETTDVDEEVSSDTDAPRLSRRLGRTRALLAAPFAVVRGHRRIDESTFEALEEALLIGDVGIRTTTALLEALRTRVRERTVGANADDLLVALREEVSALFVGDDASLSLESPGPSVWLFVGVNGVGKTTTIGKLAYRERRAGRNLVLAAGDTFRAAAGEQLEHWAERAGVGFVRGSDGADPSSVVFDAIQHAAARGAELVLADSAGRLHTRVNLMDELRKVRRVADRPPGHVTETLLVIDATTGQNGLAQAREFTQAVDVTGIVLTKLDGTAKGGIVLPIRAELGLPIKLVGLGEGIEDLVEFDPEDFASALIG